jgi:hypothetical protein
MMTITPDAASPLPRATDGRLPRRGAAAADRQNRVRGACLVVSLLAGLLGGCAVPQPWVKPYEREGLSDPIMRFNRDSLAAKHSEHVRDIREAARGATGVQGGGCGCK